jgi:hypothetical protein
LPPCTPKGDRPAAPEGRPAVVRFQDNSAFTEIFFATIYFRCGKPEFNYPLETTRRGIFLRIPGKTEMSHWYEIPT